MGASGHLGGEMGNDLDKHIFNDDLLTNADDHKAARELYPTIEHVLYHKELIDYFQKYNDRADIAKKTSRTWGKWAIALGAAAIALAAIEIIVEIAAASPWLAKDCPIVAASFPCSCMNITRYKPPRFAVRFGCALRQLVHSLVR